MLFKNNMGSKSRKEKNIALILSAFLIAFVLAGLYLSFAWDRYQEMFETACK